MVFGLVGFSTACVYYILKHNTFELSYKSMVRMSAHAGSNASKRVWGALADKFATPSIITRDTKGQPHISTPFGDDT